MSQVDGGRPNGSHVSEGSSPVARAEEALRLFATLAERRPEVVERLIGLLETLVAVPGASATPEATMMVDDPPSPLRLTHPSDGDAEAANPVEPTADRVVAAPPVKVEVASEPPTPVVNIDAAAQSIVEPKHPREKPKGAASASALEGASLLAAKFGPLPTSGGLAKAAAAAPAVAPAGLWDADADTARQLARFARAQARRLRATRHARHDGRPTPPVDSVLSDARIDDWTADPVRLERIDPKTLREGERWYDALARSLAEVSAWLEDHPNVALGEGLTPRALHERLQCAATAQKGVYCWLDDYIARTHDSAYRTCGVQQRIYQQLAHVWTKNFRTKLDHMRRDERVTSDARVKVEQMLERFELETAPSETAGAPAARARETARTGGNRGHERRFESVLDAFEAAQRDFGCEQLVFTERALESAEASMFKRPDEVYEFFEALHAIARARMGGARDGTPMEDDFEQRGFEMKPCSKKTMKRFERHYNLAFEGRKVSLSQHVTLGSKNANTCLSIHWWHDEERRRFVIGHCGKHLPNTLT